MKKDLLMKRYLSIALLAIVAVAFASCKKTYVTNTPNEVYNVTIPASSWKRTHDGKADSVSVRADAIDKFFNNNGATLVYFSFFNDVYEQIPYVYDNKSYSYIHYTGNLVLYSQPIGGGTPAGETREVRVKLVLIPAN